MSEEARKLFGQALRESRMAAGLTLRALADRAGVRFSNISSIESGRIIAGRKQAAKLINGLGLKGPARDNLMLAATLSSRRTNPALEGPASNTPFFRSLPWLLRRLGLKSLDGHPTINLCNFPELPEGHPPLIVVHEHPRLDSGTNNSHVLKAATKKYIHDNPGKHFLALIIHTDNSQTLLECGANAFA